MKKNTTAYLGPEAREKLTSMSSSLNLPASAIIELLILEATPEKVNILKRLHDLKLSLDKIKLYFAERPDPKEWETLYKTMLAACIKEQCNEN